MTAMCGAGKRSGGTCGRPAGWGTSHAGFGRCKLHLGSVGTHVVHAENLRIAEETAKAAARYGIGPEVDVITALKEALTTSYAVAGFWAEQVRELESLTERGIGGSTDVAAAVRAEERARRDLARVAVDAGRLGIEARREAIDQQDREVVLEVINNVVRRLGADPDDARVHGEIVAAIGDAVTAAEAAVRELEP